MNQQTVDAIEGMIAELLEHADPHWYFENVLMDELQALVSEDEPKRTITIITKRVNDE